MPRYCLFGHRSSGHSYKVAMALRMLDLPFDYRDVDPAAPREARPDDWRRVSPWGEIPVLLDGDRPHGQSNAILLHLASTHRDRWPQDLAAAAQWLFWEANRIGFSLPNHRWRRAMGEAGGEVDAWLEARLAADIAALEAAVADRPFLLGSEPTIADIACGAYLLLEDTARYASGHAGLAAWLDRLRGLAGWAPASVLMPGREP